MHYEFNPDWGLVLACAVLAVAMLFVLLASFAWSESHETQPTLLGVLLVVSAISIVGSVIALIGLLLEGFSRSPWMR